MYFCPAHSPNAVVAACGPGRGVGVARYWFFPYFCPHDHFFEKNDFIKKGGETGLCETLATVPLGKRCQIPPNFFGKIKSQTMISKNSGHFLFTIPVVFPTSVATSFMYSCMCCCCWSLISQLFTGSGNCKFWSLKACKRSYRLFFFAISWQIEQWTQFIHLQ